MFYAINPVVLTKHKTQTQSTQSRSQNTKHKTQIAATDLNKWQDRRCNTDFGAKLQILSHITMPYSLDLARTQSPFFKH